MELLPKDDTWIAMCNALENLNSAVNLSAG